MIGKGRSSDEYNEVVEPDFASACALLLKAEAVRRVGFLDPVYFAYYEDSDWCFRARKNGYRIKVIPESVVWHKKSAAAGTRGTDKLSPLQAYLWARNALIFRKKNIRGRRSLTFLLGQFTFRLMFNLVHCQSGKAVVEYLRGLFHGMGTGKGLPRELEGIRSNENP